MYTAFLPAERATPEEVRRQHDMLAALPFVREFLDAVPSMALVLNAERQIVLSNRAFAAFVGAGQDPTALTAQRRQAMDAVVASFIGERVGETVGCVHVRDSVGGCGTTPFCRNCGAARVIRNSQHGQARDVQECRLICGDAGVRELALDLRVWAQPIELAGEAFTIFSVMDISHEKRREALERIFFHDVMNTAGGVKGLADLMVNGRLPEAAVRDAAGMLADAAGHLIDEIDAQRALGAAESGELEVNASEVQSLDLIDQAVRVVHSHSVSRGKDVRVDAAAESFGFVTDPVLLRRVLVNLLKNALEAEPAGSVVVVTARAEADAVFFAVHNAAAMPNDMQLQIFQRSFSSKGVGRGLGTYSIKLLTERYLNGRAWFVSNEDDGTTFTVRCPRDVRPAGG